MWGGRGASRLDKLVFSYAPKGQVSGENRPLKRALPIVKLPQSAFEEIPKPVLGTEARRRFRELTAQPPLRIHLSLSASIQAAELPVFRPKPRRLAYPPTNGNAGGKHPSGKPGSGAPLWSFSAAVR